jgi:hypothetical protein
VFDAASLYGCEPQMPSMGIAAPTQHMATDDLRIGVKGLADPHNPLFWFGGLLLVTVGMAGFAVSGRAGPVKVSLGAGKS